ncbi:MAG: polysaccharide biosynthesis/export family protein [Nitrospirota bacterium]|nr:polysaccharide biosynthesis/export family protein [Nitrospirota bacterium]
MGCFRRVCSVFFLFLALFGASILSPVRALATEPYRIGVGDSLSILVWNEPQLTQNLIVLPDGKVSFPLAGTLQAAGYTTEELSRHIASRLTSVFKKRPSVSVIVRSIGNNFFYVMGAVGHAGIVPFTHNINLLQAIILAGGANLSAKKEAVILIRDNKPRTISIEDLEKGKHLEDNIPIRPQDTIIVPIRTDQIFIMGEVSAPGAYYYEKKMTVMKALINAHGFTQFASLGSVKIVRQRHDGTRKIIPIDINKVESEKKVDKKEYLKPGDMIFVPQRLF